MDRLKGKVAIVSGGATGIGAAAVPEGISHDLDDIRASIARGAAGEHA